MSCCPHNSDRTLLSYVRDDRPCWSLKCFPLLALPPTQPAAGTFPSALQAALAWDASARTLCAPTQAQQEVALHAE